MKIKYIALVALSFVTTVNASQTALARVARLQGHLKPLAHKPAATIAVHKLNAHLDRPVDAEVEKGIDELLEKISVPMTIVDYAAERDWKKVIELAGKKETDLSAKNGDGATALMLAARYGELKAVQALLTAGANVHDKNKYGDTALFYVAGCGQGIIAAELSIIIAELLINAGIGVDVENSFGQTALMVAVERQNLESVLVLLQRGANVNAKDESNTPILMWAASQKNVQILRALLKQKVAVDAVDNYGNTALIWASAKGNLEMVKALVNRGAGLQMQDNNGDTALVRAQERGHTDIVTYLLGFTMQACNY